MSSHSSIPATCMLDYPLNAYKLSFSAKQVLNPPLPKCEVKLLSISGIPYVEQVNQLGLALLYTARAHANQQIGL